MESSSPSWWLPHNLERSTSGSGGKGKEGRAYMPTSKVQCRWLRWRKQHKAKLKKHCTSDHRCSTQLCPHLSYSCVRGSSWQNDLLSFSKQTVPSSEGGGWLCHELPITTQHNTDVLSMIQTILIEKINVLNFGKKEKVAPLAWCTEAHMIVKTFIIPCLEDIFLCVLGDNHLIKKAPIPNSTIWEEMRTWVVTMNVS